MRLSFALPALAGGLLVGWSALAATSAAPTPPAAPIFYCPSAPKPAAACVATAPAAKSTPAARAAPAAKAAPAAQAAPAAKPAPAAAVQPRRMRRRYEARFAERRVVGRRPFERHQVERRFVERRTVDWRAADLSEGQRYIHDYERRHHGFEVGGEETYAGPPPCPERDCPPPRAVIEAPPPPPARVIVKEAPPQPQQVIVARAPPPPPQVIVEREAPPPPKIVIVHPPAPPPQIIFERAPAPPPRVIYERAPCPERCEAPGRYGWEGREQGGGVVIERRERERAGGWRYEEQNGRGHYEAWGDARRDRRCPRGGCERGEGYASSGYESGEWRDGSYGGVQAYAGRDAHGYLVWPGK